MRDAHPIVSLLDLVRIWMTCIQPDDCDNESIRVQKVIHRGHEWGRPRRNSRDFVDQVEVYGGVDLQLGIMIRWNTSMSTPYRPSR